MLDGALQVLLLAPEWFKWCNGMTQAQACSAVASGWAVKHAAP
jgi:hypothetical protein